MSKIIFVQAEREDIRKIADALPRLEGYFFMFIPLDAKILKRSDLVNLLKKIIKLDGDGKCV